MTTKIDLHEIQTKILEVLLFKPKAKFSELNKEKVPTDQMSFHIREMIKSELIVKNEDGSYSLTTKGKEFAGRFDTKNMVFEKQPKSSVVLVVRDGERVLTQQRLKQPYYGYYGYISGKIRFGEKLMEAATRELSEETGLNGTMRLAGIEHKMDYDKDGNILEDKFFYLIEVSKTTGEIKEDFKEGKNIWKTEEEIQQLTETFDDMFVILDIIKKGKLEYTERQFKVKGF